MLEILTVDFPFDENGRNLHIYAPDDLRDDELVPVLYMFDGQNLFDDETASFGTSWGLQDYARNHQLRCVIVGLECSHEGDNRLIEFSPYTFYGKGMKKRGYGDEILQWMIEELKPWVEENYPVYSDREHTYIGGSSMGGLMALYAVTVYNDVFGRAACLSPHHSFCIRSLIRDCYRPMDPNTIIYISWGSEESPTKDLLAKWSSRNIEIINAFAGRVDVHPHLYLGENHSETSWAKETEIWLNELGLAEFQEEW